MKKTKIDFSGYFKSYQHSTESSLIILLNPLSDGVCRKTAILNGILSKSGPLDLATKNSFPLFFVCEMVLVHMYQNHFIYCLVPYFCFATSQKPVLPAAGM